MDMGLGKTVSTLTAISDLLDDFKVNKVLIVGPLRVANTVWKQEVEKWDHLKHLRINIATGSPHERGAAVIARNIDITVINRENIPWLVTYLKARKWPYDMVIIDESTSFKNYASKRFKSLRTVMGQVKSMVLLTGTPSPNSLMDLWSQIYLLDSGQRLGQNISAYRRRFFRQDSFNQFAYKPIEGADETIRTKLSDICLTMKAEDYLELPEKVEVNQYIPMPTEAKAMYKAFTNDFLYTLTNGKEISIPTAAGLVNKLLQICNGAIYDENGQTHDIHDDKINALKELIEENPNDNFLVAYNFKSDLVRLKATFPQATVMDRSGAAITEWNKGNIRILLAHPASAGHGLNLQAGGSCVIWFGLNWSLELYQQFNARLHRQGQTKPVRIIHLVMKGGIDEKILKALTSKAETQDNLLNFLKLSFMEEGLISRVDLSGLKGASSRFQEDLEDEDDL
jgi:SNF2 family DNA or RNA helicase